MGILIKIDIGYVEINLFKSLYFTWAVTSNGRLQLNVLETDTNQQKGSLLLKMVVVEEAVAGKPRETTEQWEGAESRMWGWGKQNRKFSTWQKSLLVWEISGSPVQKILDRYESMNQRLLLFFYKLPGSCPSRVMHTYVAGRPVNTVKRI